jgi:hypothetical protein
MDGALASSSQTCNTGTNDDDVVRHGLGALECLRDGGIDEGVLEPKSGVD